MSREAWVAGLIGLIFVLVIDGVLAFVLSLIVMEENCNNGIPRWQCSETIRDLLRAALIVVPALYVTLCAAAAMRRRAEGES